MSLPEVMPFEGVKDGRTADCFWTKMAHRKPKKGEWYVSGAIPMAYKAPNDLPHEFLIVRPTHLAKQVMRWEKGEMLAGPRVRA